MLTDAPVRTSQIRALEHAAAAAWPGVEQHWLAGWLLRAGHGVTVAANSAVPLDISASPSAIPAIVDWYRQRRLTPRLAVPDRLLRLPAASDHPHQMLVRDVAPSDRQPSVTLAARPDDEWLRLQHRDVPVDVLTAVLGGEVVFGNRAGRASPRRGNRRAGRHPLGGPVGAGSNQPPRRAGARSASVRDPAVLGCSPRRDPRLYPRRRQRHACRHRGRLTGLPAAPSRQLSDGGAELWSGHG
ncbi:putative acetyltransferase [Mycobacterium xenopi 4042]|uniref:Putative acetyltransferase n=1 Tax=Mycobacterium xenopi 4042 TaxID=1299334 RepID=X8DL33_MYCXE|nr:putative acetyltransferase [Mycobacterium xenopi 4042]